MIKVYVTDGNKVLLNDIRSTINNSQIAQVIGCSSSMKGSWKKLTEHQPDILLMGINLTDGTGMDYYAKVKEKYPDIKVLVLITHYELALAKRLLEKGASGYILKNALGEELMTGIEAVMHGETFLYEEMNMLEKQTKTPEWLTPLEQEMLKCIEEGCSEVVMAKRLKVSEASIEAYRNILMMKLLVEGFSNREITRKLDIDLETVRIYRMNLIQKLGEKNSIMLMKIVNDGEEEVLELTNRDLELLTHIAEGYFNKEIAEKMFLGVETVKTNRRDLIKKFKAKNTMTMVMEGLRKGLIKVSANSPEKTTEPKAKKK
ncbi:LuxR C-terminal-related transcriptional regulator [Parabacteroides sp. PF5-9]|uniref:LuxR C-terminal-related transcriptional regulator n=1 Tax=Parabacteroides sp. PF5-9 TaxID=1742404 RepID=UPI0024766218|nr:LuxR C-terminal-related transcriptional regulator [Parabacteroides sp. PF5-9]MDH6356408.1 DNA-binding NarL/FixJ family response regulator [Parabacteroides sp. PF5-9]